MADAFDLSAERARFHAREAKKLHRARARQVLAIVARPRSTATVEEAAACTYAHRADVQRIAKTARAMQRLERRQRRHVDPSEIAPRPARWADDAPIMLAPLAANGRRAAPQIREQNRPTHSAPAPRVRVSNGDAVRAHLATLVKAEPGATAHVLLPKVNEHFKSTISLPAFRRRYLAPVRQALGVAVPRPGQGRRVVGGKEAEAA